MANFQNIVKINKDKFDNTEYTYDNNTLYFVGGGSNLLWRNPHPSDAIGSSSSTGYVTITLPYNETIKSKYLKFIIYPTNSGYDSGITFTYLNPFYPDNGITSGTYRECNFYLVNQSGTCFCRYIDLYSASDSGVTVRIYTGRQITADGSITNPSNTSMIPVEIWGTNRL